MLSGMLFRLGVNMGPSFWETSDDESLMNYYEAADLARELRGWWREPEGIESAPKRERAEYLQS